MVWTSGKVGEVVVLWMRMWEEPEAEMRVVGVGETEKISVGWAFGLGELLATKISRCRGVGAVVMDGSVNKKECAK